MKCKPRPNYIYKCERIESQAKAIKVEGLYKTISPLLYTYIQQHILINNYLPKQQQEQQRIVIIWKANSHKAKRVQ